jgi:midasin
MWVRVMAGWLIYSKLFLLQVELDVALKLLGYGHLLRKVAESDVFDYSVAQASAKWIVQALEGRSVDFRPLNAPARSLRDLVCLSSGLGITEIWSTISAQRPRRLSSTQLGSLENFVCDIHATSDGFGGHLSMTHQSFMLTCTFDKVVAGKYFR